MGARHRPVPSTTTILSSIMFSIETIRTVLRCISYAQLSVESTSFFFRIHKLGWCLAAFHFDVMKISSVGEPVLQVSTDWPNPSCARFHRENATHQGDHTFRSVRNTRPTATPLFAAVHFHIVVRLLWHDCLLPTWRGTISDPITECAFVVPGSSPSLSEPAWTVLTTLPLLLSLALCLLARSCCRRQRSGSDAHLAGYCSVLFRTVSVHVLRMSRIVRGWPL